MEGGRRLDDDEMEGEEVPDDDEMEGDERPDDDEMEGDERGVEMEVEEKKKKRKNKKQSKASGFNHEKFFNELPKPPTFQEIVNSPDFRQEDEIIRQDADRALDKMWAGINATKQRAKEFYSDRQKAKELDLEPNPFYDPVIQPEPPTKRPKGERRQVNDIFDGLLWIGNIRNPLVQLGFMRLPYCVYDGCTYDELSYNDLEEVVIHLDKYKDILRGVGGPREVSEADEERMKQGMRVAISRLKEGKMRQFRNELVEDRLRIIDRRMKYLHEKESAEVLMDKQIEAAFNGNADYNNPDITAAFTPLRNDNVTQAKLRVTQSVYDFFRRDESLGIGIKVASRICNQLLDPAKNELRTMANFLKKIHQYRLGLAQAMERYIRRNIPQDVNGPRVQRFVLEELRWFYENDLF
ncbi:hypothetical protein AAMO2058_000284500 [Amorphochlora amoebiformis]